MTALKAGAFDCKTLFHLMISNKNWKCLVFLSLKLLLVISIFLFPSLLLQLFLEMINTGIESLSLLLSQVRRIIKAGGKPHWKETVF